MKQINAILFVLSFSLTFAQTPKDYGKAIIKQLSSKEMAGRGYTNNGLDKAANFIANEFQKIGVKPFNNSYFQEFSYPVNSIEDCELTINGKKLKFGEDYLVGAMSPTSKGKYKAENFNSAVVDSLFLFEDTEPYYKEIDRVSGKAVIFPVKDFPEKYATNGVYGRDLYKQMAEAIIENSVTDKVPVVIERSNQNLLHTIASQQTKTAFFRILNSKIDSIQNVEYNVKATFNPDFKTKNVFGFIQGSRSDSLIFITAHYDHLGQIGDSYFPGANDNASGVAFMLAMAKYYSTKKPKFTTVFVAFSGEEAGLRGSKYFVEHSTIPLKNIKYLFNFDMVGTGEEGIQIVNSSKFAKEYKKLSEINIKYSLLKTIKERGESCNSDHCPFYQLGIPSFFTYTLGGASYYHDILDKEETLSLAEFKDVLSLFTKFIDEL